MGNCNLLGDSSARSDALISSISPNSALAGGPAFTLTVTGSGFNGPTQSGADSQVRWNGSARTTTFVSVTSLTATITASRHRHCGHGQSSGLQPGRGRFKPSNLHHQFRRRQFRRISPTSAIAGGAAFTLTVNGSNFMSRSRSFAGTGPIRTTSSVAAAVNVRHRFRPATSPRPGWPAYDRQSQAARTSNGSVPLRQLIPSPTLASINPNSATAGGAAFTLRSRLEFRQGSVVRWNVGNRPTTFGSATSLTASIPASDIAAQEPLRSRF